MTRKHTKVVVVWMVILFGMGTVPASAAEEGYAHYVDPQWRFSLDYPVTMKVSSPNPDELKISHSGATLRVTIFIEKRPKKEPPNAQVHLEALKKKLSEEEKDVSILEEGKGTGIPGAQGYLICSFKDRRGMQLVQLVQYYASEDLILQMVISDRPQGFKNLEQVIRKIHHSLKILNPKLK
ncbi:MAG TPA: hypothetical protein VK463_00510 [Desulfomonilaceae bacterium]|nr:hypothetical protein [Desulfomonilaceae bacterium]